MSFFHRQQAVVSTGAFVLCAVILGALILGTAALRLIERELIARAGESLAIGAVEAADKLGAMFRERKGDVEMLAAASQLRGSNAGAIRAHLEAVQRAYPVYSRLAVTNRAGLVVVSTDQALIGRDLHRTGWNPSVGNEPDVHADVVQDRGRVGGGLVAVVLSAPITAADGSSLGVIVAEVDRALVRDLVRKTVEPLAAQTRNFGSVDYRVLSQEGALLLNSDEQEKAPDNLRQSGLPSAVDVVTGRSGYVEEEHLVRHVPVITGYARMSDRANPSLQWGVLVRSDRDGVVAGIRSLLMKVGLAGLGGFIPMLAVLLWANRSQAKEHHAAATALRAQAESEARARAVLHDAMDAVVVMDAQGMISGWNVQAEAMFGWETVEVLGRSLVDTLVPPRYRDAHRQGVVRYLATGESTMLNKRIEISALRRDGAEFPIELTITPLKLERGMFFSAFLRDISERNKMIDRLRESETFFRLLSEQLPVGVFEVDEQGVCLFKNKTLDAIMDRTDEEVFGFAAASPPQGNWIEWFHPGDREALREEWVKAQSSLMGVAKECRLESGGQAQRWVHVLLWPMASDRGVRYLGTLENITARRQMVLRLRESETFFRLLSEHLPIGVFEIDEAGGTLYTNKTLNAILHKDTEEIFGFSEATNSAGHWLEWFHADDRPAIREAWDVSKDSFAQVRHECRLAPDGSDVRWVQILLWPLASDKGFQYLGTVEDITARKQTIGNTMQLLRHGRFELRTLTEAKDLAELLAYAFPDPSRTQLGLTELLVNGVEHGNLDISYAEKSALLETGRFEKEVSRRLALPDYAQKRVWISIDRKQTELEMTIADDGKGFDWRHYLSLDTERADDLHGRGIAMSKSISFDQLEYHAPGNRVTVSTRLPPPDPGTDEAA